VTDIRVTIRVTAFIRTALHELFKNTNDWYLYAIIFLTRVKPRLRVTRHAEDPCLIGRELFSQGCDWPNKNLVSIPVKQPKVFQVFLSFSSSIASNDRCFPFQSRFGKSFARLILVR